MPLIKSAIKANKQNVVKREKNRHFKSRMKTLIKNFIKTAKEDKKTALKMLPEVQSSIAKCLKKGLIKKNNLARKQSRLASMVTIKNEV